MSERVTSQPHRPGSYSVEHHPHGILVMGPVPLADFATLTKLVDEPDAVIHSGVAAYYGATIAMGGAEEMEQWAAEIEDSVKGFQPPEFRFVSGTQHGTSSLSIVLALSKDEPSLAKARGRYGRELEPDVPHDSADFGRCRRLLELRPDWVARMPEVAVKFPETKWVRLTPCWDELTALYDAKDYAKLNARIKELLK